jgi:hypothetical protein
MNYINRAAQMEKARTPHLWHPHELILAVEFDVTLSAAHAIMHISKAQSKGRRDGRPVGTLLLLGNTGTVRDRDNGGRLVMHAIATDKPGGCIER